jgi:MFS family permease
MSGPLSIARFRSIWAAQMLSNMGGWAQTSVLQWYMLPYGAVYVSLINSALVLPVLVLLWPAGILSDACSRRKILVSTQFGMALCTGVLCVLLVSGAAQPNHIVICLLLVGCFQALMSPSWYAIVPSLVEKGMLSQAAALNSTSLNMARIFGPIVGVGLVAIGGVASAVFMNMVTYLVAALTFGKHVDEPTRRSSMASPGRIHAPLQWQTRQSIILWRVISFGPISGIIWPLLPIYSAETLKGGSVMYSGMLACFGVGAASTAFAMKLIQRHLGIDQIHILSSLFFAAALVVMASTESAWTVRILLIPSGFLAIAALAVLSSEMQLSLDECSRGRGMSIYQLVLQGGMAVGGVAWGFTAQVIGVRASFQCAAIVLVVSASSALALRLEKSRSGAVRCDGQ